MCDFGEQIANGSCNAAEEAFIDFVAAVGGLVISTSATVAGCAAAYDAVKFAKLLLDVLASRQAGGWIGVDGRWGSRSCRIGRKCV